MPSIKLNKNLEFNQEEEEENIPVEKKLDYYLNDSESKEKLIRNHYNSFHDKYKERIESIYLKYYNKYNYFGFLEKNDLGFIDIYYIILNNIEIKYDIEIFSDNNT